MLDIAALLCSIGVGCRAIPGYRAVSNKKPRCVRGPETVRQKPA